MSETQVQRKAISFESSLLSRAKNDDAEAIAAMFKRFLPEEEAVEQAYYLGVEGLWGIGTHSFGCVTSRRIGALRVGAWGEVIYQDGALEFLNSAFVRQPSKLSLYIYSLVLLVLAIPSFGLALLLFPLLHKFYYRLHKCGAVFVIAEGVSVYVFTNRRLLERANALYRTSISLRERRVSSGPVLARTYAQAA